MNEELDEDEDALLNSFQAVDKGIEYVNKMRKSVYEINNHIYLEENTKRILWFQATLADDIFTEFWLKLNIKQRTKLVFRASFEYVVLLKYCNGTNQE